MSQLLTRVIRRCLARRIFHSARLDLSEEQLWEALAEHGECWPGSEVDPALGVTEVKRRLAVGSEPTAVDRIDGVVERADRKRRSRGKRRNSKPTCWTCGEVGHKSTACYAGKPELRPQGQQEVPDEATARLESGGPAAVMSLAQEGRVEVMEAAAESAAPAGLSDDGIGKLREINKSRWDALLTAVCDHQPAEVEKVGRGPTW